MNQFFLKPLQPTSLTDEQSDYERLLQLCESYGLNEQETQQLMDEFQKGGYDKVNSMKSSLNQSMMSDQYEENQKDLNGSQSHQKEELRTYSNNFYQHEHQDSGHPEKSTDRYYGYHQEQHPKQSQNYESENKKYSQFQDDQVSYNQMTFNHQQENQDKIISDREIKISQIKNYAPDVNKNIKKSESKLSLKPKSTENLQQNFSQTNLNYQLNHNNSNSSAHSQNSYHSVQNQHLNPLYVKQLIQNFQLLEKEADDYKQKNVILINQQTKTKIQNQMLKKQLEQIKKQRDDLKMKSNLAQSENFQLKSSLESQKVKTQTFKSIKERDSQIIQGLKDSILQFTLILKEKDAQSNDLQNKLIQMYEKNEKLNQQIYNSGQNEQNGSMGKNFEKLGSKKSLVSQNDEKEQKINFGNQLIKQKWQQNEKQVKRQKSRNQARRQLSEIILNGMSNQQSQQMGISQSNKQLIRQASTSKIVQSQTQQQNMEKQSTTAPRRPPREIKENVFVGVEVEGVQNSKTVTSKKTLAQDQSRKRGSSRVDIKKYKGMIEELRNSYSNVPGNMIR